MKEPRRKRRVPAGYLPFPLSIRHDAHSGIPNAEGNLKKDGCDIVRAFKFEGLLHADGTVTVPAYGDTVLLYKMGFFGKGTLSRHEPTFNSAQQISDEAIKHTLNAAAGRKYTMRTYFGTLQTPVSNAELVSPQEFVELYGDYQPPDDDKAYSETEDTLHNLETNVKAFDPVDCKIKGTASCEASLSLRTLGGGSNTAGASHSSGSSTTPLTSETNMDCVPVTVTTHIPCFDERDLTTSSAPVATMDYTSVHHSFNASFVGVDSISPIHVKPITSVSPAASPEWETDDNFWLSDECVSQRPEPPSYHHSRCLPEALEASSRDSMREMSPVVTNPVTLKDYQTIYPSRQICEPANSDIEDHGSSLSSGSPVSGCDLDDIEAVSSLNRASDHSATSSKKLPKEDLLLDPVETVFLMYAFDCLRLKDTSDATVSLAAVWSGCLSRDIFFLPKYAVYHHFRSKGWIPKDGLSYGCDFVVYKKGPPYYHSSFGVIVRCCDSQTLQELPSINLRCLSWPKLMGLSRVINNVRKELVICYVLLPANWKQCLDMTTPNCIRGLTVCDMIMTRIIPSRERDQGDGPSGEVI